MKNSYPWSKFYWSDWENDPALRVCSLAAQGLWMRLLCIAARSNPTGFIVVAGRPCSFTDIALLTGVSEQEVERLLDELSRNGVFSRDAQSRIFSRRMVRDTHARARLRKNGAKGGRSSYLNQKGIFASDEQMSEQGGEQEAEPKKEESRIQKNKTPESPPVLFADEGAVCQTLGKAKAHVAALSADWSLSEEWRDIATDRGWGTTAIDKQAMKFRQYFCFGRGADKKRSPRGWKQTWLNWLDRALKIDPDAATFGQSESPKMPASYPPLPDAVRQKLQGHFAFNEGFIQRWLLPCLIDLEAACVTAPSRFHAEYLESRYGAALEHALGRRLTFAVGNPHQQYIPAQKGEK
ncbi:MAG: hypothetical protein PHE27_08935 [Alphaproteobacteria bacterium]|nr:hypothetical protein [Alphaproteobacteria bacterium]